MYNLYPINPMPDGTCRTIKHQYSFTSIANTVRTGSMGATMVAEKLNDDVSINEKKQIYRVYDKVVSFKGKYGKTVSYYMDLPNGVYNIRKLSNIETFKLFGFTVDDVNKCKDVGLTETTLFKLIGNSIVVNCIKLLFQHVYKSQENELFICEDETYQNV